MKEKRGVFICIIVMVLLLCGIGAKMVEKQNIPTEGELIPIRVAVQEYFLSSPIGYIIDHELDKKMGLEIIPVFYPTGAEQITDIENDVYDVATIGAACLYPLAQNQAILIGEHVKCTGGNAIYVRKDSPILDVKGFNPLYPKVYGGPDVLKDRQILMKGNTTSLYLGMKWLESVGTSTDFVKIEYQDFAQVYESFKNGYGDAAVLPGPYSYQAEKDGFIQVASMESLFIENYEVIVATNQACETKREDLVRFMELLLYANELLESDFNEKLAACENWYKQNEVEFTISNLKRECRDKIFITKDNYQSDNFGESEYKYAEYMAATGNLDPMTLKNVNKNMDKELFREALGE
ncbi:MAG: ABC transporter substrate-binding protein [Lachnospiraceae bacterium]